VCIVTVCVHRDLCAHVFVCVCMVYARGSGVCVRGVCARVRAHESGNIHACE